jgi:putative nucleotidyltransferase with HDIG domain
MIRDIMATLWARFKKQRVRYDFKLKMDESERGWVRWFIVGGTAIVLVLLFPQGQSFQFADLKEGSVSNRRVVAPFNFEILKTEEEISKDRSQAVQYIVPLFVREENVIHEMLSRFDVLAKDARRAKTYLSLRPKKMSVFVDSLMKQYPAHGIESQHWKAVLHGEDDTDRFWFVFRKNLKDILDVGVLNLNKNEILAANKEILIQENRNETLRPLGNFYDPPEAVARIKSLLVLFFPGNNALLQFGAGIAEFLLKPDLVCDAEAFRQRVSEVMSKVPLSSGFVYENEKIVDRNERITPEIRQKLVSLSAKLVEKGMKEKGILRSLPYFGKAAFVLALFFLIAVFVFFENTELLFQTKPVFLFSLVILLVSITTFFMHRFDASEYLVPAAAGAMLLAAMFDTRVGFAGTAVLSVLVGGLWGNEFSLVAVSFFTGVVGVIAIKRVRSRSQLIKAVLVMMGTMMFAITFMGFLSYQPFGDILEQWQYGALNGLFTPIVVYGLLALFESIFDITTDFSLLELSNLNHPLLKQLSVEAPGTYHHSIMVGNLAEAGAQAVNANSLLARVGSYYHDIGKIEKAEYFVENQIRGKNPHRKLTPRMSALILTNHVKKSLEFAEEHKLPSAIKGIMVEHHGRSIMEFFYQKAITQKAADEDVNEEDYRYPGPKPQTKESAIVMLADAVEAASRTLKQPTHSRLKGLIEDLVDERFKDGELDEAPVTLRDLEKIKEAFLTILAGTFHTRVEYPDQEQTPKSQIEEKEAHTEHPSPPPDQVRHPESSR